MKKQTSLNNIEKAIEDLSPEEQLRLVERVAHRLRRTGIAKKDLEWGQLYGLGKACGRKTLRGMSTAPERTEGESS